jgi:hypothetical protein
MGDWAQVQMNTSTAKASGSPARPKGVVIPAPWRPSAGVGAAVATLNTTQKVGTRVLGPTGVVIPALIPAKVEAPEAPEAPMLPLRLPAPAPVDTTLVAAPQAPILPAPVPMPPPVSIPPVNIPLIEAGKQTFLDDPRVDAIIQGRKEEARKQKLLERQEKFQDDMLGKKLRQTLTTTEPPPARSRSPNRISKAGSLGAASSNNP